MLQWTISVLARADVARRARGSCERRAVFLLAAVCGLFAGAGSVRADVLYVSEGPTTTTKVDAAGTKTTFVSSGLNTPEGLRFDSSGNLYVANQGAGTITKVTPGGSQ